jgi:hypothetical protein
MLAQAGTTFILYLGFPVHGIQGAVCAAGSASDYKSPYRNYPSDLVLVSPITVVPYPFDPGRLSDVGSSMCIKQVIGRR